MIIWSGEDTLKRIEERSWLKKENELFLNKSLPFRVFWQKIILSRRAKINRCDVLFIPGGSYSGNFRPYVILSQNLLPFEWTEMKRYGFSWQLLRNLILRKIQFSTFRKADGVIFLTNYAKQSVIKVTGQITGSIKIVPHV